jgi:hypothetical protein
MAQDDLTVANASGAAVRADVNANLQALGTLMSGATAPSTTWPFMWWADTANDLLKQRNAANSAWITKGTLSAAYGGLPASSITYDPGSPNLLAASDVQAAIDELAASLGAVAGGMVEISRQTASNSATLDFTGIDSTYDMHRFEFIGVRPVNDDVAFQMRVGTGGTPTYQASAYTYGARTQNPGSGSDRGSSLDSLTDRLQLTTSSGGSNAVGNAAGEGVSGFVEVYQPSAAVNKRVIWQVTYTAPDGASRMQIGGGAWDSTTAITALRFFFSANNIQDGAIVHLARKK